VHAPANARDHYGLSYAQFVVPLVRAVQEQQTQIATLQQQNAALQQQNATLKAETTATTAAFKARLRRLESAAGGQAQR
jgi:type II secretory pathway component PulM